METPRISLEKGGHLWEMRTFGPHIFKGLLGGLRPKLKEKGKVGLKLGLGLGSGFGITF